MAETAINESNFEAEVLGSDVPVLLDFWAVWCGPCMMLAPIMTELSREYEGRAKICKVNVDECPGLAERFGVSSIPTVLLFKDGRPCATSIGYRPKSMFEEMLK